MSLTRDVRSGADAPERGVRARTRTAILDAAAAVWARDFSASLATIAERAEVSRSTLHRYFTDRQALIDALLVDSLRLLDEADSDTAGLPAIEVLERYMRSGVEMGDRVIFLFSNPERFEGNPHWVDDDGDEEMTAIVERARAEGTLDPAVPTTWVTTLFYAVLYTAAEVSAAHLPRHVAADLAVRSFLRSVAPD